MNTTAIKNVPESFLYYDPVYGTKYNKVKSSIALASASAIGGTLGYQYDHPIVGCITGAVITSGILWFVNKDKSKKPINDREVSIIIDNLTATLEHDLQTKNYLANKIQQGETELVTTKAAVYTEKNANKLLAEENLTVETKKYEQKFDEKMQAIDLYLHSLGVLNYAYENSFKATGDVIKLIAALKIFKDNRNGSFLAVNNLLQAIPIKLREHSPTIRHMLLDIGSRPTLRKITGPVEQQYINTKNKLNQDKLNYHNITNEIAAARKVYSIDITNGKVTLPNIETFRQQMPN